MKGFQFLSSGSGSGLVRAVSGTVARLILPFTTLWASKFTTTGTGTYSGLTLGNSETIGTVNEGTIAFLPRAASGHAGSVILDSANALNNTTNGATLVRIGQSATIAPASGSGSFAMLHIPMVVSGVSTGTAYGAVIASKTNTLTGGFIKPLSIGITTTDAFSGYSEKANIDLDGTLCTVGFVCAPAFLIPETTANLTCAVLTSASGTISSLGIYLKNNQLVVAHQCGANGQIRYLTITLDGVSCAWVQSVTAP